MYTDGCARPVCARSVCAVSLSLLYSLCCSLSRRCKAARARWACVVLPPRQQHRLSVVRHRSTSKSYSAHRPYCRRLGLAQLGLARTRSIYGTREWRRGRESSWCPQVPGASLCSSCREERKGLRRIDRRTSSSRYTSDATRPPPTQSI